ncbi:hypothetical protein HZB60_10150 [candidate division KSB1 bacterium]|nr:hypothetical protein [candidate division KSB1 bacterium]
MPRDYSKPPRSDSRPKSGGFKPGGPARKPYAKREGSFESGGDRPYRKPFAAGEAGGDRPYRKPYVKREGAAEGGDRPYRKPFASREGGGDRPFRKPYGEKRPFDRPAREYGPPKRDFGEHKDFRPPRYDDETFTATGKVAEIVGSEPLSKMDMLHKLWDFFRDEELITNAGRKQRPSADEWRNEGDERPARRAPRSFDEAPPKRAYRKPAGEHPAAKRAKTLEGVPRRKFKETRGQ